MTNTEIDWLRDEDVAKGLKVLTWRVTGDRGLVEQVKGCTLEIVGGALLVTDAQGVMVQAWGGTWAVERVA